MPNRLRIFLGITPSLICACFLRSPAAAGEAQISLQQFTQIAQSQLQIEVLPRLFYNGFGQIASKIEIVETGAFPAARQVAGSDFQINSVAIAIMDRVAEADFDASSTSDIQSLDKYLRTVATLIFTFARSAERPDWRRLLDQMPKFPARQAIPEESYGLFRRPTLTNLIGSVLVRELIALDLAHKYPGASSEREINRLAAARVAEAKFEAAPPTSLVVYSLLKKASSPEINQQPPVELALEKSLCDESSFQSFLRFQNMARQSEVFQSNAPFSAGRKIMMRYASCQ